MKESPLISIGFRVTPKAIFYSIVQREGTALKCTSALKISFQSGISVPKNLAHVRRQISSLSLDFKAKCGGIKLIESNSRKVDHYRLNVEGVIQEAMASSSLESLFFGNITNLTKVFGDGDKSRVKRIIEGKENCDKLDLDGLSKEHREAALAAAAAILNHGH
jgi:hypothetical protein